MNLRDNEVVGLNVETVRGFKLGRIRRIEVDTETQQIQKYWIRSSWLLGRFSKTLIIHRDRVVSLRKDKMVVEDLEVREVLRQEGAVTSALQ